MLKRQFYCFKFRPLFRAYSMKLSEVVSILNQLAPTSLAESWDNVGLLVEPYTQKNIRTILLTNDLTEEVMKEALQKEAELILSYHPPLFQSFKKISQFKWKDRILSCCLENGVAVYSPHTCYDALKGGVNDWLIKAFDLVDSKPIQPSTAIAGWTHRMDLTVDSGSEAGHLMQELRKKEDSSHPNFSVQVNGNSLTVFCQEDFLSTLNSIVKLNSTKTSLSVIKLEKVPITGTGMGRIGELRTPITLKEAVDQIKIHLGIPFVRLAIGNGQTEESQITSVAVCAGSGISILRGVHASLYLTGEMSHHDLLDAIHAGVSIILTEHSNSERGFLKDVLQGQLQRLVVEQKVQVIMSNVDRDPVNVI